MGVEMKEYLESIADGRVKKYNPEILSNMQTIMNLLPNLNVEELVKAMFVKTNDMHMVIYLSSLIRSVIALHDLVNNKIRYNQEMYGDEEEEEKVAEEKKEAAEEEEKKKKNKNDVSDGDK